MRRFPWRQATLVGLVILFLGTAIRIAWLAKAPGRQQEEPEQRPTGPLAGLVIVVDPGHGGFDPGAVVKGTREKEITLQVALVLKEFLEARGARVVLTRTGDEDLAKTIRADLSQRVALITEHRADLYLSLHANKDSCNCWGAQTFYQKNGIPGGKVLALAIQGRLREMTPTTRYALPADYFVLRTAPVPAVIVEMGFLTNSTEHARLLEPDYQRTLATAIALGVEDYRQRVTTEPGVIPHNPADPDQPERKR